LLSAADAPVNRMSPPLANWATTVVFFNDPSIPEPRCVTDLTVSVPGAEDNSVRRKLETAFGRCDVDVTTDVFDCARTAEVGANAAGKKLLLGNFGRSRGHYRLNDVY